MAWKDIVFIPKFREAFQGRTREVELGMHTIRSHGATVARSHKHDWVILLLLVVIEIILNIIHPFYRFVGKDMMEDLKYPMKDNTVPVWAVPIYAVLLPIVIFNLFYLWRRSVYDLHHSVLGLLFAVLITGVLTDSIKDAVGRPRPDFFWRCFPDGKDFYDQWGNVICHGKTHEIREGHKSFPSGHTSWSFAGLGFLSLYLAGKIRAFDRTGHVAKLCIVFLPLLAAALVGVSRVDDYWHHWQDVFAGGLLGLFVATMCYLQFFPPPYHIDDAVKQTIEREGAGGLFKGMGAPLVTVPALNAILFTARGQMEARLRSEPGSPLTINLEIIRGAGGVLSVSFLACATELIKCRSVLTALTRNCIFLQILSALVEI